MKKYQIIYADPPWTYRKSGGIKSARGLAKSFYQTMDIEEIKNLPIQNIVDANCYLFLWTTAPCMQEGLDVLKAWGFKYFTVALTWIKENKNGSLFWGMGNSTRANPEYCLLGRIGKLKRIDAGVHSVIMQRIMEHSRKPHEARTRIERLYGDLQRIELFARQRTPGWDVWGNEVESDITLAAERIGK